MLTPQQITQIRTSAGVSPTPPAPTQTGANDIITQRKVALGMISDPSKTPAEPSLGEKISSDIQSRGQKMNENLTTENEAQKSDNPLVQGLGNVEAGTKATGNAFGAVTDIAGDIGGALLKKLGVGQQPVTTEGHGLIGEKVSDIGSKAYDELGIRLNDFVSAHPELGKALVSILGTGQGAGETAGGILTGEATAEGTQKIADLTKKGIQKGQDVIENVKNAVTGKVDDLSGGSQNDLQKIQETISPKPTVKEAKIATQQGRFYQGKEPTFFKGGGEDKLATSDQQFKSVQTINRLIPNAAKMDEPTLYSALDDKVSNLSEELKPAMEKTPINEDTVQKITDEWDAVKTAQKADPYLPDNVNIDKLQSDFEERLKSSENGNMNDLWETRKAYDASVPSNVKNATDLSSEALQAKKTIWLQNRQILSNAINDTVNGMGETSRQAFSDMRDMYEAQNGILSKAKVETTATPSKFSTIKKAIKEHPAATALGAIGADKIIKSTTGIGF